LLTGLSGAARRIGFHRFHNEGLYRGEMLTHRVAYNPHIHIAKNFMALILAAAAGEEQIPYTKEIIADDAIRIAPISVPDAEIAAIRAHIVELVPEFAKPMRLLLLNPNASEMLPQRRWPSENFVALARLALARWEDLLILVTGAPSERLEADALCQRVGNPRMVNFAGHSRLDQLPALYSLADLMVTNDSGPGHFASVTSLPTITLFGPETPALYGALGENAHPISAGLACSPCVSAANHRKTACSQPVCMERISPETVFALVETLLLRA
jgi:ADP-heptose:LPS heptosyltransferase